MFGHCLCGWLNLIHCCIAALDSTVRFSAVFMSLAVLISLPSFRKRRMWLLRTATRRSQMSLTACGSLKVVARDLDTSAVNDAGERKQKITAVVTTGVVWSQVHLAEIWLQSLQCCQRVFDYRRHRKPVLSALVKYMDVGSCLKRILEWLNKKKTKNSTRNLWHIFWFWLRGS